MRFIRKLLTIHKGLFNFEMIHGRPAIAIGVFVFMYFITLTAVQAKSSGYFNQNDTIAGADITNQIPEKQSLMNVYFLSGLGADERAFSKLKLDETRFNIRHIKWIKPLKKETLEHYAVRLTAQIDTTQPFHLVGLSLGGIMASILSDIVQPDQIVIISSTATGIPVSRFYQGLIKVILFHPLSGPILKSANSIVYRYFGADTPEMKALLKQILKDTDTRFMKWALIRVSSWQRNEKVKGLYHIHGTADKLIPIKLVSPDIAIEGGGHLMVLAQHEQISSLLNAHLKSGTGQ
jgi:pimeloyl-ACP methyl ester carboxylesterase